MVIYTKKMKLNLDLQTCMNNCRTILNELRWKIHSETEDTIVCKQFYLGEDPFLAYIEWPSKVVITFRFLEENLTEVKVRATDIGFTFGHYLLLRDYMSRLVKNLNEYHQTGKVEIYPIDEILMKQLAGGIR